MKPKVSVIVPCYNLGAYLEEAIDSVFAQTLQDFEIVIVNDGSTDPMTRKLLADFQRPRTRVLHTENRGLAKARNLAIEHASGDYICALDADDRLAPTLLEKSVAVLESNPDVAFVSCWLQTFGDEEWTWKQDRCDLPVLLAECTVCTAAPVRRAALMAVGGFDEQMPDQGYEDWELWISLVERGFQGVILPEVLFHYRRRRGSMSSICCHGDTHLRLMRYLVQKHLPSYRAHLTEVLGAQDRKVAEALQQNDALERHLHAWLRPELHRREEELERLRARLENLESRARESNRVQELLDQVADLERRLVEANSGHVRAQTEITLLRASKSWRVTAPLRAAQDWIVPAMRKPR